MYVCYESAPKTISKHKLFQEHPPKKKEEKEEEEEEEEEEEKTPSV
jgi:ribosomal protein L12E/L44/L45/RPP1/RPP2